MEKSNKNDPEKPAELFRLDFISNMKVADSEALDVDKLCRFTEPWRQEWNCGVQVPLESDVAPPRYRHYSNAIEQYVH